jgi:hypothetical protein
MDCSYTSLLGLERSEINVGIASACLSNKCWDDGESCCGKEVRDPPPPVDPGTGVGGGRKELFGTAECAPPGGGAKDVKLIPAACDALEFWNKPWDDCAELGKSGAGGKEKFVFDASLFESKTLEF